MIINLCSIEKCNIKEDVARAYNIAATKHFGEFAVLNNV